MPPGTDDTGVMDEKDAALFIQLFKQLAKQNKKDNKRRPSSEGENPLTKRHRTMMGDHPNG